MNKHVKNIETSLNSSVQQMIPKDMFDRIAQNIAQEERTICMNTNIPAKPIKKKFLTRRIGAVAAACVILMCGVFGGSYYFNNLAIDSVVNIDVNPGIEISTNKNDMVLNVTAINSDAEKVLDGMNLKNTDLKIAVNAIIGSMAKNGYLTNGENSILVTVQNHDVERAAHVRNIVLSDIDVSLKENNLTASVVNQTIADNDAAKGFATEHGITFGKSTFVLNLCAKDASLDPAVLAKMSLKDIAALVVEKHIDIRDIVDYDKDDSIWENIEETVHDSDETVDKDAEDDSDKDPNEDTDEDDTEDDADNDTDNDTEHDPDEDTDEDTDQEVNPSPGAISTAKAKEIALAHAGVSTAQATFFFVELDTDDAAPAYDIEFTANGVEYDYEIHPDTGAIISCRTEAAEESDESDQTTDAAAETGSDPAQSYVITLEQAKDAALQHAAISDSAVVFSKGKIDMDEAIPVYELDFCVGSMEYAYEIDALTGSVLHHESAAKD